MLPNTPNQNNLETTPSLLDVDKAWQLHEEVRAMARQQLRRTQSEDLVTPATMADTLKRLFEQVTGDPMPQAVRSAVSKRLG